VLRAGCWDHDPASPAPVGSSDRTGPPGRDEGDRQTALFTVFPVMPGRIAPEAINVFLFTPKIGGL
jgi:hypothetical protein